MEKLEKQFLMQVNALIDERLTPKALPGQVVLATICRHLCISKSAKRVRPLLCLYYQLMFDEKLDESLSSVATASEFIHAASLLHDDIIDEADKRRGKASANHQFGNAKAVLAGDYLLSEAFDILRPLDRALCEKAILVVKEMTAAAILELNSRGQVNTTLEELLLIAKGKTGVLFSWCGFATATLAKDEKAAVALWQVGESLGVIFQIVDDLKDFDGDQDLKDICRDIRNKEPSVPMILAMNNSPDLKEEFIKAFSSEVSIEQALELKKQIISARGVKDSLSLVNAHTDKIMSILSPYKDTLGMKLVNNFVKELLVIN